jgi:hypothetical protein
VKFTRRKCLLSVHPVLKNYSADYEQLHRQTLTMHHTRVIDEAVPA